MTRTETQEEAYERLLRAYYAAGADQDFNPATASLREELGNHWRFLPRSKRRRMNALAETLHKEMMDAFAAQLASIRVLYRQDGSMDLWGLPYELREGLAPRDIWDGAKRHNEAVVNRPTNVLGAPAQPFPPAGWVWLGSPGWWGGLKDDKLAAVKDFLVKHKGDIPGNIYEWAKLPG